MIEQANDYYELGCNLYAQRQFATALHYYDLALRHGYSEYEIRLRRAHAFLELNKPDQAAEEASLCLGSAFSEIERQQAVALIQTAKSRMAIPLVLPDQANDRLSSGTLLTENSTTLPSFLVIGAQKSGTTSLYSYLAQHPQIKPAVAKEVHYFDYNFDRGLDWYKGHFPAALANDERTGEASPLYIFHPHAAERIYRTLPEAKLLVLLRNPIDRAYSHYQMMVRRGLEKLSFDKALRKEESRIIKEAELMEKDQTFIGPNFINYSYMKRGLYAEQLERWFSLFPREQFFIMDSELLSNEPQLSYSTALQFLGLPNWELKDYKKLHSGDYRTAMDVSTREYLCGYFKPHNERLFELLGERYAWD